MLYFASAATIKTKMGMGTNLDEVLVGGGTGACSFHETGAPGLQTEISFMPSVGTES